MTECLCLKVQPWAESNCDQTLQEWHRKWWNHPGSGCLFGCHDVSSLNGAWALEWKGLENSASVLSLHWKASNPQEHHGSAECNPTMHKSNTSCWFMAAYGAQVHWIAHPRLLGTNYTAEESHKQSWPHLPRCSQERAVNSDPTRHWSHCCNLQRFIVCERHVDWTVSASNGWSQPLIGIVDMAEIINIFKTWQQYCIFYI